ncbi:unnamed protein product, partial [marine sediment metagenome]
MVPEEIKKFISDAKAKNASDVHICANTPVMYRIGRKLMRASHGVVPPDITKQLCYSLLSPELIAEFERNHDVDLMLADGEGR